MQWDAKQYHIDALTEQMACEHPDVKKVKADIRSKVADAVNGVQSATRQNRSSADKYPMPPVNETMNPTGAFSGKKNKGK